MRIGKQTIGKRGIWNTARQWTSAYHPATWYRLRYETELALSSIFIPANRLDKLLGNSYGTRVSSLLTITHTGFDMQEKPWKMTLSSVSRPMLTPHNQWKTAAKSKIDNKMDYPSTVSLTDMPKHHHQLSIEPIKIQFDSVIQKNHFNTVIGLWLTGHQIERIRGKIHGFCHCSSWACLIWTTDLIRCQLGSAKTIPSAQSYQLSSRLTPASRWFDSRFVHHDSEMASHHWRCWWLGGVGLMVVEWGTEQSSLSLICW